MGNNPTTIPQNFVSASVSCLLFMLYVRVVRAVPKTLNSSELIDGGGGGGGGENWIGKRQKSFFVFG